MGVHLFFEPLKRTTPLQQLFDARLTACACLVVPLVLRAVPQVFLAAGPALEVVPLGGIDGENV